MVTTKAPTHHSVRPFRHAWSERAPVARRAQHAVEDGQRRSAGGAAEGLEGQPHCPVAYTVQQTEYVHTFTFTNIVYGTSVMVGLKVK